ncbi:Fucose 4-O-acetylase [Sphingobium sp. AP50]|uniref:acyltransferase family protein n=1 Tax=Sphingobium sp. AP50 TaxID=1884369 RepID=UPI0008D54850|nr:acyltransferase [Sphingobium sp. AP50]SEJ99372.1 Fucose 4-O-acetylase [Sphingobium sp. AP50]
MGKNPSIDLLKGMLMLLVMAGHAMELTHQQHLALWIGAGFRMPLMIGISGYLLNVARTRSAPSADLFKRYGERMLLPWAVALIAYVLATGAPLSWQTPLDLLLRPPFHLWYVPVLFFLIVTTRLVRLSPLMLLAIGAPISVATMYAFGLDHAPIGTSLLSPDSRYIRYPVYFFFGMLMAERGLATRYLGIVLLVLALGLTWWSGLQGSGHALAYVPARLMMNLSLIALLPLLSTVRLSFAPLNRIGRDSLFFYLWHPMVMGMVLMSGLGGPMTLALSVLLLAGVSRATAASAPLRRWLGSAPPSRRPQAVPEDGLPQPA